MLKLVEALDITTDWSDHGLYWPGKTLWLSRTRSTLDQYGVQSDANLWFTPMHKGLRVMMPDLQMLDLRIDFSINVFSVVIHLCKKLGIRHPEELSLSRKMSREELKRNKGVSATRRTQLPGLAAPNDHLSNRNYESGAMGGSPYRARGATDPQGTLSGGYGGGQQSSPSAAAAAAAGGHSPNYSFNANGTMSPGSAHSLSFDGSLEASLINSPKVSVKEAFAMLNRPRNLAEKARINAGWLDSSRSLLEQGIEENGIVLLRFKFSTFYDINPKYDAVRINQIYEQARWSLISEELDCTEEEMIMFAAIQLQVQKQSLLPQPSYDRSTSQGEDEIDFALTDLQASLEGESLLASGDITRTPELRDYLRFFKPRKFAIRSFKRCFFIFKDTYLSMHKRAEDANEPPVLSFNLKGCEVSSDAYVLTQKFSIHLFIPGPTGMIELWIRTDTEEQFARWSAAFKLAAKGHTMADSSYEAEVRTTLTFLSMQHPASDVTTNPNDLRFEPDSYVAPRFLGRTKTDQQLCQSIMQAHSNVSSMNLIEAKLNYIKAWQSLPEYGFTYFIMKLRNSRKEDLLAVVSNRLIRMDLNKGDSLKMWRFQNMKSWSVNWEIKQVQVAFEDEEVVFHCLTADCKVVHEFIGGYIFLSMRSGDKNQSLDEELFHKLTGGWL